MKNICLDSNGVIVPNKRMEHFTTSKINSSPPKRLDRIRELLRTKEPKICVIRGEGLGDVIMTLPTISALKKSFGGKVNITYATNMNYLGGALSKVLKYNTDINTIIDRIQLKEEDYDCVINLHCPCIAHEVPMAPPINRIDLFAKKAGVVLENSLPKVLLHPDEIEYGKVFLNKYKKNYKAMLVQLFSSSKNRDIDFRVLRSSLKSLYEKNNIMSFIITHSTDNSSELQLGGLTGVVLLKDKDVRELGSIMVHCDLVIAPDSSILHLAGALEVPVIGIFGGTDPHARVNHYPSATYIWKGEGLPGHPHWYAPCPTRNSCFTSLTEEDIITAVLKHIEIPKVNIEKLKEKYYLEGNIEKSVAYEVI